MFAEWMCVHLGLRLVHYVACVCSAPSLADCLPNGLPLLLALVQLPERGCGGAPHYRGAGQCRAVRVMAPVRRACGAGQWVW